MRMAKPDAGPRFFKRRGPDLTVKDSDGVKHHATLEPVDRHGTHDTGAFAFGYCKSCDWTGPARRARDKARTDAVAHQEECTARGRSGSASATTTRGSRVAIDHRIRETDDGTAYGATSCTERSVLVGRGQEG